MKIEKLLKLIDKQNVAESIKEERLAEIGIAVGKEYQDDLLSRKAWDESTKNALKFAKQIMEPKNFPFKNSSNIILPLLTTAAVSFASRVYPEIVRDVDVVSIGVCGQDPTGELADAAARIERHMNFQILVESDTWEPDMDKLLNMLPIVGTCFKKVYYDPLGKINKAELCEPQDIVINYRAASLESAPRVTHRHFFSANDLVGRMRSGLFLNYDIEELESGEANISEFWNTDKQQVDNRLQGNMYEILEQHRFLDLDDDGYEEPYIVTVHRKSLKVLAIYPRFDINSIELNEHGEVVYIKPRQFFVDYHFLPSPDGAYYSVGYGQILYPINKACNTLVNQLVDAGTFSNTKGGLISRNLKMKGGKVAFQMGELIPVEPGVNGRIQDGVMLFDFGQPSPVLFQLLGMLVESAKEIASINDVMLGQAQTQNSPAGSMFEQVNQGMKVYSSIAKRTHRSLKKEFALLFNLNKDYLSESKDVRFNGESFKVSPGDYSDPRLTITPVADPKLGSDMRKMSQFQAVAQLIQSPAVASNINMSALLAEYFKEMKLPETTIKELLTPQQQGPNPDMMKGQLEMQKLQQKSQTEQTHAQLRQQELQIKAADVASRQQIKQQESEAKIQNLKADSFNKAVNAQNEDKRLAIQLAQLQVAQEKLRDDSVHKTASNVIQHQKNLADNRKKDE